MPGYPATVAECIQPMRYKREALSIVRGFAKLRPWNGTTSERLNKMQLCLSALCHAYRIEQVSISFRNAPCSDGAYLPFTREIILFGNLSVVTFLHEFAHALGKNERDACIWSINLFKRCFPKSFARCRHDGHKLIREP